MGVRNIKAFGTESVDGPFREMSIARREVAANDVEIDILFCGICHSDLHYARNEWSGMPASFPCVPGHEIVGRVQAIGAGVSRFKVGDLVGVGCLVDADRSCPECQDGLEQYCPNMVLTYGSPDKHLGGVTHGGYAESIVVDENFVLRVPENLDPAGAALRRDHHLVATTPLAGWRRTEGWRGRTGWTWTYGGEVCESSWGTRRCLHDLN